MAIEVNYDLNGDLYPGAYVKVQKIVLSSTEIERFEEQEDGTTIMKFEKIPESIANIFVYPDKEARMNNARPIHYFGIEFKYDEDSELSVFEQAYSALKRLERFKDEDILDI
jgi:hypothetical protein